MAANQIVLSLNINATYAQFNADLSSIINKMNSNPRKIKLGLAQNSPLKKDLTAYIKSKINSNPPEIKIKINPTDTQRQLDALKKQIVEVAKSIERLGGKSAMNQVAKEEAARVRQIQNAIKEIEKLRGDKGILGINAEESAKEIQKIDAHIEQLKASFKELTHIDYGKFEGTEFAEYYNKMFSETEQRIEQARGKIEDSLTKKAIKLPKLDIDPTIKDANKYYGEYIEAFDRYKTALADFEIEKSKRENGQDFDVSKIKEYVKAQEDLLRIEKQAKAENKVISQINKEQEAYQKLTAQVLAYGQRFKEAFAQNPQLMQQYNEFLAKLKEPGSFDSPQAAMNEWLKLSNSFKEAGLEVESTWSRVKKLFADKFGYAAMALLTNYARQALRQVYENVVEVDSAMTELKKVTDETASTYQSFLSNSSSAATSIGATMSDYINSVADFARLGYNLGDSQELATVANIYKNVADGVNDIGEATSVVISTMKAFNLEVSDSMHIADAYNEVGNNFAISSAGIGEALQRSASAMAAANNTFEETIGLAVAMNDAVQDPQKVGNTLKTVSMYIRAAKTDLEAASEETDGMADSVSKLRDVILQLTAHTTKPVDILGDNNTYKSTYQVLKEISEIWDQLTDKNQAFLLEKLGGKRNANAVASLLTNFKDAEAAMQTALNSTGSAIKENETYLDSVAGKITKIQSNFQAFSVSFLNTDFLKGGLDTVNSLLQGITWIVDQLGALPPILAVISGYLSKKDIFKLFSYDQNGGGFTFNFLSKAQSLAQKDMSGLNSILDAIAKGNIETDSLSQHLENLSSKSRLVGQGFIDNAQKLHDNSSMMENARKGLNAYGKQLESYSKNSRAAAIATTLFNTAITLLASLAIQEIIQAISQMVHAVENAKQSMKDYGETVGKVNQTISNATQKYSSIKDRYFELAKGVNYAGENVGLTNAEFEEYKSLSAELAETFPSLITGYSSTGEAILSCRNSVEALDKAYQDFIETQKIDLFNELNKNVGNYRKSLSGKDWSGLGQSGYQTENDILQAILEEYNSQGGKFKWNALQNVVKTYGANDVANALADAGILSDKQKTALKLKMVVGGAGAGSQFLNGFADEIENGMAHIAATINSNKAKIEEETNSLKESLLIGLNFEDSYNKLSDNAKSLGDFLVNSFTSEDFASGMFKGQTGDEMVNTFVSYFQDAIKNNPDLPNLFSELINLDRGEMSIGDWRNTIQKQLTEFAQSFGKDTSWATQLFNFDTALNSVDDFIQEMEKKLSGSSQKAISEFIDGLEVEEFSKVKSLMESDFADGIIDIPSLQGKIAAMDSLAASLGIVSGNFSSAASAAKIYNDAVKDIKESDYDYAFNTYSGASDTIKAGIDSGNYRTKEMQFAVQFLYGDDVLSQLMDGTLSISALRDKYNVSKALFQYKDAKGILDHWKELTGNIEGFQSKITKNEDGVKVLEFYAEDVQRLADAYGTTTDVAQGFFDVIQGGIKLEYNMDSVKSALQDIGALFNGDTISKSSFADLIDLLNQNYDLNIDSSQLDELVEGLERAEVHVIDFSGSAEELADDFAFLAKSGEVDIANVVAQMVALGATKDEVGQAVDKLEKIKDIPTEKDITITGNFEEAHKMVDAIEELPEEQRSELIAEVEGMDSLQALHDIAESLRKIVVKLYPEDNVTPTLESVDGKADELREPIDFSIEAINEASPTLHTLDGEKKTTGEDLTIRVGAKNEATPVIQAVNGDLLGMLKEHNTDLKATDKSTPTSQKVKKNILDIPIARMTTFHAVDSASFVISKIRGLIDAIPIKKSITVSVATAGVSNALAQIRNLRNSNATEVNGTAFATGYWGAKRSEKALVGELGAELRVDRRTGRWDILGENGAEFANVHQGDIIFNAEQTQALLAYGKIGSRGRALLNGTAFLGGTAYAKGTKKSSSSSSSSTAKTAAEKAAEAWKEVLSEHDYMLKMDKITEEEYWTWFEANYRKYLGSYKENLQEVRNAEVSVYEYKKKAADRAVSAWQEELSVKDHLLKIGKISEADYWEWYAENYKKYLGDYKENVSEVWKAEEAIIEKRKKAYDEYMSAAKSDFDDYDSHYKNYTLGMDMITEDEYWDWYKSSMEEVGNKLGKANDFYRELELNFYKHEKEEKEKAYDAVNDLVNTRISMIKQEQNDEIDRIEKERDDYVKEKEDLYKDLIDKAKESNEQYLKDRKDTYDKDLENFEKTRDEEVKRIEDDLKKEKDILNDRLKAYQKLAKAQINALKSVADQEDYLKSQGKKRKDIADMQYQLEQYRLAGDATSKRKALELEAAIADAQDELDTFERDHAIQEREDAINDALSRVEESINNSINNLEDNAKDATEKAKDTYQENVDNAKKLYDQDVENNKKALEDIVANYEAERDFLIEIKKGEAEDEINVIKDLLNNQKALRDQAIKDIENDNGELYQQMIEWNEKYGDGITQTIVDKWDEAARAAKKYGDSLRELSNISINDYVEDVNRPGVVGYQLPSTDDSSELANMQLYEEKLADSVSEEKKDESGGSATPAANLTKGATVTVKASATHFSSKSRGVKMASFVPGSKFTVSKVSGDQVLLSDKEGYIGWVKKSDLVGYARGTDNAVGGLAITDELGAEIKMVQDRAKGKYSLLNSGDFVFTHEMSKRLYEFAKSNVVQNVLNSLGGKTANIPIGGNMSNSVVINMGDINVSGSATSQTVSEIRREQRKQTNNLLKELKRLK